MNKKNIVFGLMVLLLILILSGCIGLSKLKWSFQTENRIYSSPTVADGIVYFGGFHSDDYYLYAVDLNTGQEKWKFETKGIVFTPSVTNKFVYFGSWDENLYAVDVNTGKLKWKFKTSGAVESTPTISNGVIYFGSGDFYLYAVDINTGQEKWKFKADNKISAKPIVLDDVIYFSSNYLYALDINTVNLKWKFKPNDVSTTIGTSVEIKDGFIYFGNDHYFYAVDINTGQEKWKFKTNDCISSSPIIVDRVLFFGSYDGNLYALNLE